MGSPLLDRSLEFASQVVLFYEDYTKSKKDTTISKQLLRSATSIGANIREAKYAHGKADFIAKLQIALKECYETEYWIEIAQKANIVSEETVKTLLHGCGAIRRMLIASINTSKESSRG